MRQSIPFRQVNRRGTPQHDPTVQGHHLLPRQLLSLGWFARLLAAVGYRQVGFDDFRRNGLLLPAHEEAVWRLALPLHRGPHRDYNAMVFEKVGAIERRWSYRCRRRPEAARDDALADLASLQSELRYALLNDRIPVRLNRRDPLRPSPDFSSLDALAEDLWRST